MLTRARSQPLAAPLTPPKVTRSGSKRVYLSTTPLTVATPRTPPPSARKRRKTEDPLAATPTPILACVPAAREQVPTVLLHPPLSFSFEEASAHLHSVDQRWGPVIQSLRCKPFQPSDAEDVFDPFRSLVSSIIGQQVSWLAARSILHKFQRVFYPDLPERLERPQAGLDTEEEFRQRTSPFPTPQQLVDLPNRTEALRGAGLSGRKVEYVVELSQRFVDGRLNAKELWSMDDDDQVERTLVACRGIGVWTAHMFQIFSMKRPNVIPVGDLGIQKALCKWYSSDPFTTPLLHPKKLSGAAPSTPEPESKASLDSLAHTPASSTTSAEILPAAASAANFAQVSIPLETSKKQPIKLEDAYPSPQATPLRTSFAPITTPFTFPPTTSGLTPAILKTRLAGKKIKCVVSSPSSLGVRRFEPALEMLTRRACLESQRGAYLTPQEVRELCQPWEPYCSVAMWYLWAVLSDV
ncbi:BQ2448_7284 [Microbotryum intermedium]|uniref:BQ2448_7284 protein n=1 Tax=Microbotryum intermedium TaxID=269621 RepID=A0A238FQ80_9BASI|nr:BQ2448_7284 [Microbotryum intermedium]